MNKEVLSVRQLAVTAFVGSLAPAVAGAAYGWQGALIAVPVLMLGGRVSVALAARWPALEGRLPGYILKVCCAGWGIVLLSRGLYRSAARLSHTGGGGETAALWLVWLLAVPLMWMSFSKSAAFFRTAEVCYLAMLVVGLATLVWAAAKVEWRYLTLAAPSLSGGLLATVEAAGTFLFLIPYIYREGVHPGDGARAMGWLLATLVGNGLLATVTVGVLSPSLLPLTEEPFFTMTATLGKSIRVEGLVSALWLLADLMYLGLLSRSWHRVGRKRDWLPAAAIFFAAAAACFGLPEFLSASIFGVGTAVLWGVSSLALWLGSKK